MAIEFLDTRGLKIEGTAVRLRNNFLRIVSLVTKFVVTFRSIQPKFISLLKINRLYVIGIEPAKQVQDAFVFLQRDYMTLTKGGDSWQ